MQIPDLQIQREIRITVDFYKFPSWKNMEISHVERAGDVRHSETIFFRRFLK